MQPFGGNSVNKHSPVQIDILTLFPAICEGALSESIMKRAQEKNLVSIRSHNLRNWARDKHHITDEPPYGGGQGMVLKAEPIFEAVEELSGRSAAGAPATPDAPAEENASTAGQSKIVLMSPAGRRLDQTIAAEYAQLEHVIIVCGHYEGVDQRVVDHLVDDEISIGDYVLTNGAIAAIVFVDAFVRLIPGVLGDEGSAADDSFAKGLLEFPQYTRPVEYRGWRVPDILLSGNHGAIAKWRAEQSLEKTRRNRPDLLGEK